MLIIPKVLVCLILVWRSWQGFKTRKVQVKFSAFFREIAIFFMLLEWAGFWNNEGPLWTKLVILGWYGFLSIFGLIFDGFESEGEPSVVPFLINVGLLIILSVGGFF